MLGAHPALAAFDGLPLKERLFVRARLFSAPLVEMANHAQGRDLLDVGCGHGALVALLAVGFPDRQVTGLDPDARKIDWARASVGRFPNVHLHTGTVERFAETHPAAFDTIVVADVLYLLPPDAWPGFLRACRSLLRTTGRLVLKEAEDDGSWRVSKALLQEQLMVRVLRRTHESGSVGFQPRARLQRSLEETGFSIREIRPLSKGYTTPHVLFVAECA